MLFRNPVDGYIHPLGWSRPYNNNDFVVTQWFGCTGFYAEPPLGSCLHFHRAIDIANGHCGAPVYAVGAGRVRWSGVASDGANIIVVDHGSGWGSAACHLSSRLVATGAYVAKGQKIGYIGSTGNSTGCHDHFPIKSGVNWSYSFFSDTNGVWQDPWKHLEQNCLVRPQSIVGINIRATQGSGTTLGAVYASVKSDLHIHRASDNADLGAVTTWRSWGGAVTGASYKNLNTGATSNVWDKIWLGGAWRFVALLYDQRSLS